MTLAQELAKRINAVRYEDLPPDAIHWAKVGILDTVGVTLAGAREETARIVENVTATGAGAGTSLLFGGNRRVSALDAAVIDETLGVVLKAKEDLETVRGRRAAELLDRAISRRSSQA